MGAFVVFKMFWLSHDMTFPWESNIKIVNHFGETIIKLILFTFLYPETIKYGYLLVFKMFWLSHDMKFPWEAKIKVINHFSESIINHILLTTLCPETIKYGCLSCIRNVLIGSRYDICMRIKYKTHKSFQWKRYQSHFIHFLISWDNKIWVSFLFSKCSDCLMIWHFHENQIWKS